MRYLAPLLFATMMAPFGCQPDRPPPKGAADPSLRAEVSADARRRDSLAEKLAAAEPKLREACEFRVGECLLSVADERESIVGAQRFPDCEAAPRSEAKRCVERNLLDTGSFDVLRSYYAFETRCLDGIADCIVDLERQERDAHRARTIAERRAGMEADPELAKRRVELVLAEQYIEYVRGTLPPDADGACTAPPPRVACDAAVDNARVAVEKALGADDASYSADAARAALEQLATAELHCPELERQCLDRTLAAYGATAQSNSAREKVFALLAERHRLRGELSARTSKSCVDVALADHMPRVVETYRQFSRQRGEYFMLQLHNSFATLYSAENACLARLRAAKRKPG